jgi:hypothetical protein
MLLFRSRAKTLLAEMVNAIAKNTQVRRLCKEEIPSRILSLAATWCDWHEREPCESLSPQAEDWLSILCSMLPAGVTPCVPRGRLSDNDEQAKNQSTPSIDA